MPTKINANGLRAAQRAANKEHTFSSGVRVRLRPIPALLITKAMQQIKDPPIPVWHDPERGRDLPNPTDPDYVSALDAAGVERTNAALDVAVQLGLVLVDGLPSDNGWIDDLQYLERLGLFDLSDFDMTDPKDREFIYKRYFVVADAEDIRFLTAHSGLSSETSERAEATFPSDSERDADNAGGAEA
jgi:hypothetical protein